jgi:hypothetical protein
MAENEGNVFFTAEIGEPIPGEDAFNGNDNVLSIWSNGFEKDLRVCFDIPVKYDLSFLVEDAEIHRPGMQIDAAVKFVLLGVKSHLRPPFSEIGFLNHTCFGYGSGGP